MFAFFQFQLLSNFLVTIDLVERLRLGLCEDEVEHVRGDVDDCPDQEDQRPVGQLMLWWRGNVKRGAILLQIV